MKKVYVNNDRKNINDKTIKFSLKSIQLYIPNTLLKYQPNLKTKRNSFGKKTSLYFRSNNILKTIL